MERTAPRSLLACVAFGMVTLATPAGLSDLSAQDKTADSITLSRDFETTVSRIDSIRNSRDLEALEKLAEVVESTWSRKNVERYGQLMSHICNTLTSVNFGSRRQYVLAQHYALGTLTRSTELPIEVQTQLLLHLKGWSTQSDSAGVGPKSELLKRRSVVAELWLQTYDRIQKSIDPNWDPDDEPLLNISPPGGTGLPAGVAPEAIQDSALRAQYEREISANEQKSIRYNEQYKLRQLAKSFIPRTEEALITLYSWHPLAHGELEGLLKQYVPDPAVRTRIFDSAKEKAMKK